MDLVRAADGRRTRLGQSQRPHLALLDEPLHRADRFFDRRVRIDAVLVVEVDYVDAQALEARFAGLHDVLGPAGDALLAARVFRLPVPGRAARPGAPARQRAPEAHLVVAP